MIQGFGDIFRYNEALYVFLAANDEIIYAAKILDPVKVRAIEKLNDKRAARHDSSRTDGNKLFWYVMLTTTDFENYAAHLANTDQDATRNQFFEWLGKSLNDDDLARLKEEISQDGSPTPKGLKEMISSLL